MVQSMKIVQSKHIRFVELPEETQQKILEEAARDALWLMKEEKTSTIIEQPLVMAINSFVYEIFYTAVNSDTLQLSILKTEKFETVENYSMHEFLNNVQIPGDFRSN